jgi:hypothetical protein
MRPSTRREADGAGAGTESTVRPGRARAARAVLLVALVSVAVLAGRGATGRRAEYRMATGWTPVPSGETLRRLSFGYDRVVADVMWIRALQYFGEKRLARAPMPRLGEYIDATVALDPNFVAPYVFGGLVMMQDLGQPEESVDLLLRGMAANPDRWELPFELGFLLFVDAKQPARAAHFFELAAAREGCPAMARRFAAWTYAEGGDRSECRRICEDILSEAGDERMRTFAQESLARLRIEEDLETLRAALGRYRERTGAWPGSLPALVAAGDMAAVPEEPRGGFYAYRPETGQVDSSTRVDQAVQRRLGELEDGLARFRASEGRNAGSLEELVTRGFASETVDIFGLRFRYDPESGRVWAADPWRA